MSTKNDQASVISESGEFNLKHPKFKLFYNAGSLLQLVLLAVCFEMVLGISDGVGILLRLFLFAVVMLCVVVRIGWLSLIAIQFSLLIQEPRRGQLSQAPAGFFWVLLALLTIIAAMKLPQVHRIITDMFLRTAGLQDSGTEQKPGWHLVGLATHMLQLVLVVVSSIAVLVNVPIGRNSGRWLQSSMETGQAFWPGTLWLVLIVALFVLARELTWRRMERVQASLYLRSVRLIANYRDLIRFERERFKRRSNGVSVSRPGRSIAKERSDKANREANVKNDSKDTK